MLQAWPALRTQSDQEDYGKCDHVSFEKKNGKISFIVQRQAQEAYQWLQIQELHKQSGQGHTTHAAGTNIKLDTAAHKPAQLQLVITLAIIHLHVTGNVDVIDMLWVVRFQVGCLAALWLLIVRSDNAILAIN